MNFSNEDFEKFKEHLNNIKSQNNQVKQILDEDIRGKDGKNRI